LALSLFILYKKKHFLLVSSDDKFILSLLSMVHVVVHAYTCKNSPIPGEEQIINNYRHFYEEKNLFTNFLFTSNIRFQYYQ
jgi:hypothetical protein